VSLIRAAKDAGEPDASILLAAHAARISPGIEAERLLFKQTQEYGLPVNLRERARSDRWL